jgi:hypothetical protein
VAPHRAGNESYFEAEGRKLDMLGWSGHGLTVIDLVAKNAQPLKGEPWFTFLREIVLKNQCGTGLNR